MSTYQELLARQQELAREQAELERQIQETLRAERAGVIQQIKAMMAEHGLTVADLSSGKPGRPARSAASGDTAPARKVAPKYRDPETGETWSGRGLKPKWLSHAIENGRTLEEFTITQ
ncbi:H-NS histone family protein [Sphaerotilus natans]|uniref:H-NS histone family protein n=1 Tax=Sphaerotilus natans TaxID=34103 RepID=UPI0027E7E9FB|nr:DNA-binding protein [Pseudomonadota bacterium]